MEDFTATTLILSLAITWTIGLTPPLLIRYAFLRRAMAKKPAIGISALFWFLNIILFIAMGSKSKTHAALLLIAYVSYWILRRGDKKSKTMKDESETQAVALEGRVSTAPPVGQQKTVVDEERIYVMIAKELETGVADKGLWTRLFAECGGDEKQTKVLYIKQRADRLISAERSRLEQAARNIET